VDDADVDELPGDDQGAAGADSTVHAQRLCGGLGCGSGGPGVADVGQVRGGERVRQAAQQDAVVYQLHQSVVQAHGDVPSSEAACRIASDVRGK
jgi:hypothetical protein